MKTKILILLLLCFYNNSAVSAQTEAFWSSKWDKFIQLAENKKYQEAVKEGVKVSLSFTQEQKFQEAFATCRQLDALINKLERETEKAQNLLRYIVTKERLRIYSQLKNSEQSNRLLGMLNEYVLQLESDSIKEDFWLTEAQYYYQVGMSDKSLESYKKLLLYRTANKEDSIKDTYYKEMLTHAETTNNPSLAIAVRKLYGEWQDSIKGVETAKQLDILSNQQKNAQEELEEAQRKIQWHFVTTVISCSVGVLFLVALLFTWLSLMKNATQVRKQNLMIKSLEAANLQKSKLISSIAAQIEPSLFLIEETTKKSLPVNNPTNLSVDALKQLIVGIENYMALESTKEEKYLAQNLSISNLCKEVMEEAKVHFKPEVTPVVIVPPHVSLKTNEEIVKKILLHLLTNASNHTTEGRITLEFKKRRADSGQFIITDTGSGLAANEVENLFIPFSKVSNLLEGNGLGLPTCALMAYKLNGALSVDLNYKKGARFIFELYA